LKQAFRRIFDGKAWKKRFSPLSKLENDRRRSQLHEFDGNLGIEERRRQLCGKHFFLSQLSDSSDKPSTYDDLLDTSPNNDDDDEKPTSPALIKQKLLHILMTECHLNKTLHGSHAIVRSDFEWFGPSLAHSSILTVLEFFGMGEKWLTFFKSFLGAPLRFKEDVTGELRVRKCGTPIGYALSIACGETILFVMDFAVNQRAGGMHLYRMHDDLWLWDSLPGRCAAAWHEMKMYASLVGLRFNAHKTGSACIGTAASLELPEGDIRWGFLKFDPEKAQFVIDQADVDGHIDELRHQLAATKSVFGWVNAYNKYMAFFVRNFGGRPAACFGQDRIDDMVDTLARIQRTLFPNVTDGAVGHLRSMIEARFGVHDLPQGYFYFPIASGGLELRNPMIELFAVHRDDPLQPESAFAEEMEKDRERYRTLGEKWESSTTYVPYLSPDFMSFEEYVSRRETRLPSWGDQYSCLLSVLEPTMMPIAPNVHGGRPWLNMDYYERWVVSLYGEEVVSKFGGWDAVDPTLIPVGMVQLFRSSRMKLDQ
jgi:hypothetical protein